MRGAGEAHEGKPLQLQRSWEGVRAQYDKKTGVGEGRSKTENTSNVPKVIGQLLTVVLQIQRKRSEKACGAGGNGKIHRKVFSTCKYSYQDSSFPKPDTHT